MIIKKRIEKTVAILLALLFVLTLASCSKKDVITAFNEYPYSNQNDPDTHYIVVDLGTPEADIPFPMTLKATIQGGAPDAYSVSVAKWTCVGIENEFGVLGPGDYDPNIAAVYRFVPTLALDRTVVLSDGLEPPYVNVVVTLNMEIMPLSTQVGD